MSNKTWIYISLAALGVALYLYYRSSASGTPRTLSSTALSNAAALGINVSTINPNSFEASALGDQTYIDQLIAGGSTSAQIAAILGD
jgi:hypothetical protein